jgi:hypothetical protein
VDEDVVEVCADEVLPAAPAARVEMLGVAVIVRVGEVARRAVDGLHHAQRGGADVHRGDVAFDAVGSRGFVLLAGPALEACRRNAALRVVRNDERSQLHTTRKLAEPHAGGRDGASEVFQPTLGHFDVGLAVVVVQYVDGQHDQVELGCGAHRELLGAEGFGGRARAEGHAEALSEPRRGQGAPIAIRGLVLRPLDAAGQGRRTREADGTQRLPGAERLRAHVRRWTRARHRDLEQRRTLRDQEEQRPIWLEHVRLREGHALDHGRGVGGATARRGVFRLWHRVLARSIRGRERALPHCARATGSGARRRAGSTRLSGTCDSGAPRACGRAHAAARGSNASSGASAAPSR